MTVNKLCLGSLLLFCAVAAVLAQEANSGDPVILGDEKLFDGRFYTCRGNAELFYQTYHVFADEIVYDTRERIVRASGRVAMSDRDNVISGDSFTMDLKAMKGEMENVFGLAPPTLSFQTPHLRQTDPETFRFDKLTFSSCGQLNPDWSIASRKGKIKKDRYIEMSDLVFRINLFGGLPVFYLPYLRYPIQKDGRSTGFLFPEFGHSKQKGPFIRGAFFWDIASNADLTLKADWYGKVGIGLGADLRYIFHGGVKGEFSYYRFRHRNGSEFSLDKKTWDYQLKAVHSQNLPFLNTRLTVNVSQESNPMLNQLFSDLFYMAHISNYYYRVRSETRLLKNLSLIIGASSNEIYYTNQKNSNITEYMPSIQLNLSQQKLSFIPGYLNIGLSAERVSRSGESIYPDDDLYDWEISSERFMIKPKYTLPVFDLPWLNLNLDLASQFHFYSNRKDPTTKLVVDEPIQMVSHSLSLNLQGLKLERVYRSDEKLLQHLFYPEVRFTLSSTFDEETKAQVVRVDNADYSPYSSVSFLLHNFIRLKKRGMDSGSPRQELLSWTLGVDYYLDPEEANYGRAIDGEYVPWGPVRNQLRFHPAEWLSLTASLSYNSYVKFFQNAMLSLQFGREDQPAEWTVYYSAYKNPYNPNNPFTQSSLGSSIRISPDTFPLSLRGNLNYNITQTLLSAGLMMDIKLQCWSVGLGVQQRQVWSNGAWIKDFQFQFGVRLGHLSMLQDLLSMKGNHGGI